MIITKPIRETSLATAVCLSTDVVGDLVYISGNIVGGDYQVQKIDPTTGAKMPAIGVIVAKLTPTRAVVQREGAVKGVYTGLVAGKVYFAGANSQPSVTCPTPGYGGAMYVQPIGIALDSNVLQLTLVDDITILRG